MVHRVLTVALCDECDTEDAHTWTIVTPIGVAFDVDLCDKHQNYLIDLSEKGRVSERRRRGRIKLDDIEVMDPPDTPTTD